MTDSREEFEFEFAQDSDFTESQMKFLRSTDGGYQNRDLHNAWRGWHLAKTQRIRQALRGGNLTSPYQNSPWRNHAASGMRPVLDPFSRPKPKWLPTWREWFKCFGGGGN